MARKLTTADGRQSLHDHVAAKGAELCAKYGPVIGWRELQVIMEDRAFVRYPCKVEFNAGALGPGEFAYPEQTGEKPEDGFVMFVHPLFMTQLALVPHLVLYQLVLVNYGAFASAHDAEAFGAAALGLAQEEYYHRVCQLADQLGGCDCA